MRADMRIPVGGMGHVTGLALTTDPALCQTGYLAGIALRLRGVGRQLLIVASAFGNNGSFPFVLVLPVFSNWSRYHSTPQSLKAWPEALDPMG